MNLSQNPDVKPARLIEYLRDRAGLLISRGVGVYTFPHRTFQEYLAACYLTDHDYPDAVAQLARQEPNRWREVVLLAGAKAARGAADFALWALVDTLSPEIEIGSEKMSYWGAQIAGQAIVEIANLEKISVSNTGKIHRLRIRLLDIMEGNRLPAVERAQEGSISQCWVIHALTGSTCFFQMNLFSVSSQFQKANS
jgi:predicted NACHT family NTPase